MTGSSPTTYRQGNRGPGKDRSTRDTRENCSSIHSFVQQFFIKRLLFAPGMGCASFTRSLSRGRGRGAGGGHVPECPTCSSPPEGGRVG